MKRGRALIGGRKARKWRFPVAWRVLALLPVLVISACDTDDGPWQAIVYTRNSSFESAERIPGLPSLDQCRETAKARLKGLGAMERGYYRCGYDCGAKPQYDGAHFCTKIRK